MTCRDPGIFVKGGGGGGGGVQFRLEENSMDNVVGFFFFVFFRLQFTEGLQWFYYRDKDPTFSGEGGATVTGGSNFFLGGPNANFYRNPYNL